MEGELFPNDVVKDETFSSFVQQVSLPTTIATFWWLIWQLDSCIVFVGLFNRVMNPLIEMRNGSAGVDWLMILILIRFENA